MQYNFEFVALDVRGTSLPTSAAAGIFSGEAAPLKGRRWVPDKCWASRSFRLLCSSWFVEVWS